MRKADTSNTVWKFPIETLDLKSFSMDLPKGAEIIRVDVDEGRFCFWALVDPAQSLVRRDFYAIPTGSLLPDWCRLRYIGQAGFTVHKELMLYFFEPIID